VETILLLAHTEPDGTLAKPALECLTAALALGGPLTVGLVAVTISVVIGTILGIISAIRRGKFVDNLVTVFANIGITAPQFWVACLLIYLFGLKLKLRAHRGVAVRAGTGRLNADQRSGRPTCHEPVRA